MSRSRTSPEPVHGLMVVFTAPSGTGKTTVARRLLEDEPDLAFSVSHTTRPPRPGEVHGVDYWFVSDEEFDRLVDQDAFAEWAPVHSHRYGTSHAEIRRLWAEGKDILFDIDPQGGLQLVPAYPEAATVFMVPPSMAALEERLRGRATDTDEHIAVRLNNARREIALADHYRYLIVNDTVEGAVRSFRAVLEAERSRTSRHREVLERLLHEGEEDQEAQQEEQA
ncbi:MAG: guanylate kinase [Myxococcota bacterium]